MVKYSRQPAEPSKSAKCRVDDLRAHFKTVYETARATRGLNLLKAIEYINNVIEHKALIPFRRFTGGPGRHAMCKNHNHHNGNSQKRLADMFLLSSRTSNPTLRPNRLTQRDAKSPTSPLKEPSAEEEEPTEPMVESLHTFLPTVTSNYTLSSRATT